MDVASRPNYRRLLGEAEARCRRRRANEEVPAGVRALNRSIIISNDVNPVVDGRWGRVVGREGAERSVGRCHGFGKLYFYSCEPYSTSNKTEYQTNYEYLSQFVIPNWGMGSAFNYPPSAAATPHVPHPVNYNMMMERQMSCRQQTAPPQSCLQGKVRFGGGGSSLHSGIEFGRSRTGEGSSGGRKRGVV